ncbi:RXLR effector domain-containing protein [Phytophthora infestans]|uniref:RxLR effector protein n=1 Tax=Phytophthora infestans TaxID=4787 RepID=A0A8S9UJ42_PHYIN|nr:RXLR effector domain-containing protein [Phytophthora infestans]
MRLSCVYLVVATVTTIIASANAAAEASEPMPNIAKYASPEVSVHLGAEREKRLLRFDSNDYRDDDDEEERANAANLFNVTCQMQRLVYLTPTWRKNLLRTTCSHFLVAPFTLSVTHCESSSA